MELIHQSFCDECDESVALVCVLGAEPDYESSTANVCKECLLKAIELMDEDSD